jgi:YecR-like lipoprotein
MKLLIQSLFMFLVIGGLAGCASTKHWSAAGGNREEGVVRVSYEYPEFQQPQMSESQAQKLALSRCNSWGYRKAEPIAGQIRQCANMDDGNCDLWSVTREFQCSEGGERGSFASRLSR